MSLGDKINLFKSVETDLVHETIFLVEYSAAHTALDTARIYVIPCKDWSNFYKGETDRTLEKRT